MSKKLLSLVSLVLLAGCSSSSGGGGGGGGASTPTDFETSLDTSTCAWKVKCGYIGASEQKACVDALAAATKDYPLAYDRAEAVKSGRLKYDATLAAKCLEDGNALGCTLDQYLIEFPRKCAPVFTANVAVGGACKADIECIGGYCNMGAGVSTDGCPGTCAAYTATGATCDSNDPHCAPTDSCNSTSKKCVTRAASGAACGGSNPSCQTGLFCRGYVAASGTTPETPGTCGGPGKVGDACAMGFFGNTNCTPGLWCDDTGASPVCREHIAAGAECKSYYWACADGTDCIGLTLDSSTGEVTTPGHCGKYLDVNSACAASDVTGCPYSTSCDATANKCLPYGALGADCSDAGTGGSCGDDMYCDGATSKCTKMVGLGAACTPATGSGDDPCQSGSCDATAKTCTLLCK
jgi:hypothetical protein